MARGIKQLTQKALRKNAEPDVPTTAIELIKNDKWHKSIKPKQGYMFFSDYFKIDGKHAVVLSIMHDAGADDNLSYFWGISLIPRNLPTNVSVRKIEQVRRMTDSWVSQHQSKAEGMVASRENDVQKDGTLRDKAKQSRKRQDLEGIAQELLSGASYLKVSMRLLVKAPTLKDLDKAVDKINRNYKDQFDTVFAAPYMGDQKREFSGLFRPIANKLGKNFMFTSSEYAGNYNLVTHGIEDATGEYVGIMSGDVNQSAVIFDIDEYEHHIVIAGPNKGQTASNLAVGNERGVDIWGAKVGMSALMRNRRVVHLVMNGAKIDTIGVDLSDITAQIDMGNGDINMFELFGDKGDELSIFTAHLNKLVLMAKQMYATTDHDRGVIEGSLREIATTFYVDKRMWAHNAQNNRERLRLVGIPHEQVPLLPEFTAYLDMEYTRLVEAKAKDNEVLHAYSILRTIFKDMLGSNGDLFNTVTSSNIDRAKTGQRVIYDFSSLIKRGRGVAMAQFVNALGFAVGTLNKGDLVVLHGVDQLSGDVKEYVKDQFTILTDNGVRVAYIYTKVERMVKDVEFNEFDKADYTILGGMSEGTVHMYEQAMHKEVSHELKRLLVHSENSRYYLRRRFDNIIFDMDVQLGIDQQAKSKVVR